MALKKLEDLVKETYIDTALDSPEAFFHAALHELGFSYSTRGTFYLKEMLLLALDYPGGVYEIPMVKTYKFLAEVHDTDFRSIERSIRHSITRAWDNGNTQLQIKLFSYCINPDKGRPSNQEFICLLINLYKRTLRNSN